MALRNQPYIPLYVNDFMTDEKLTECSAESTGVYIRLMCLMHKSEEYGKILLGSRYDFATNLLGAFAEMLSKKMPYKSEIIERSLTELLAEKVVFLDGNRLCQKRMIKDAELSEKRALSGSRGGAEKARKKQKSSKSLAKHIANTENEYENENVNEDINTIINYLNSKAKTSYKPSSEKSQKHIRARFNEKYTVDDFKKVIDIKCDEWLGGDMEKYLRPETLFGTKFESYLNQKPKPKKGVVEHI